MHNLLHVENISKWAMVFETSKLLLPGMQEAAQPAKPAPEIQSSVVGAGVAWAVARAKLGSNFRTVFILISTSFSSVTLLLQDARIFPVKCYQSQ
jgi:hypothetical protein